MSKDQMGKIKNHRSAIRLHRSSLVYPSPPVQPSPSDGPCGALLHLTVNNIQVFFFKTLLKDRGGKKSVG